MSKKSSLRFKEKRREDFADFLLKSVGKKIEFYYPNLFFQTFLKEFLHPSDKRG